MDLANSLAKLVPAFESVVDTTAVGGGCISDACRVDVRLESGTTERWFVKSNDVTFEDNFDCEREGLDQLRQVGVISVPQTLATGVVNDRAWLLCVGRDRQTGSDFFANFGRSLANLHRETLGAKIGLDHANYLGGPFRSIRPQVLGPNSWLNIGSVFSCGWRSRVDWSMRRFAETRGTSSIGWTTCLPVAMTKRH